MDRAASSARRYLQQGITSLNIRVALRLQKLDQRTQVIFILFFLYSSFLRSTHFTFIKGRYTLIVRRIKFVCWRESSDGKKLLTQPEDLSPVPRTHRKGRPWWGSCNPRKRGWEDWWGSPASLPSVVDELWGDDRPCLRKQSLEWLGLASASPMYAHTHTQSCWGCVVLGSQGRPAPWPRPGTQWLFYKGRLAGHSFWIITLKLKPHQRNKNKQCSIHRNDKSASTSCIPELYSRSSRILSSYEKTAFG